MANTIHHANRSVAHATSTTVYLTLGQRSASYEAAEALAVVTSRVSSTFKNLYARVIANTITATTTVRFRVNLANGNQVLSVGASTTGEFEDNVNTDSVISGDEWNANFVTGGTGTTITFSFIGVLSSGPNTYAWYSNIGGDISSASVTTYAAIGGFSGVTGTVEADKQLRMKTAGTAKNLKVITGTNNRTTNTVFRSRVNGANGAQTFTIAGGTTGFFDDSSNTDTLAVDDLLNISITTGTGTEILDCIYAGMDLETTNNGEQLLSSSNAGLTVTTGLTRFIILTGRMDANTTELDTRAEVNVSCLLSKLAAYVSANTIVEDSTLRLRKNGANANQVVPLTGLTTGYFEDGVNTDSFVETDEGNYSLVTGATGTNIVIQSVSMLLTFQVLMNQWYRPIEQRRKEPVEMVAY